MYQKNTNSNLHSKMGSLVSTTTHITATWMLVYNVWSPSMNSVIISSCKNMLNSRTKQGEKTTLNTTINSTISLTLSLAKAVGANGGSLTLISKKFLRENLTQLCSMIVMNSWFSCSNSFPTNRHQKDFNGRELIQRNLCDRSAQSTKKHIHQ